MKRFLITSVFLLSSLVAADIFTTFEKEHMDNTHHIEISDEVTFFKLHDLDRDGYWNDHEVRAIMDWNEMCRPMRPMSTLLFGVLFKILIVTRMD
ncbi:unnamed protein product [Absidia cylindrospora]